MKQKIKLSDVRWAYTGDGVMMPIILNKDFTRYKDLSTNTVYSNLGNIEGYYVINSQLKTAVADTLGVDTDKVYLDSSSDMLYRYGRGLVPYYSSITLHKFGSYLSEIRNRGTDKMFYIEDFCKNTGASPSELAKIARIFTKQIQKQHENEVKKSRLAKEYQEEHLSF